MFNIGKAEEIIFASLVNVYPTSTTEIEANVSNGDYDLSHPNNVDAQGLPAIDYLLYGAADTNEATVELFSTSDNAANYQTYLTDLVARISDLTSTVVSDWNGDYRDAFVNNSGNTATSSLNLLVNDFVYYYEKGFRANKFGIPGGVFSTDALPEKVEALYNRDLSKDLALEALQAIEDFFNGKNYNSSTEQLGLKAYLEALDREDISEAVLDQIALGRSEIEALDDDFYQQIVDDRITFVEAYDELQKVVPYLKSDMLSALDISVDYVDADGD